MLKKSLFVGGASVLLLALMFGADAASYVATGVSRTREAVKNSVSVEFQLDRARGLIKQLDPEIAHNMHKLAKEEVALEELSSRQTKLADQLARSERDILRLRTDLERGDSTYVYVGRSFSGEQVKNDLANRFTRHKTLRETHDQLEKTLQLRRQALATAQDKLRAMQAARGQLEAEVASLQARLEMVQVAKTSSDVCHFDDSALARARSLLQDIETRIGVDEKLLGNTPADSGAIELEAPQSQDLSAEISVYFGRREEETVVTLE